MMRRACLVLLIALGTAMMAASLLLYRGRARDRVPGIEGLDAPDVADGFNRVALMPQMRLLRWFVARRASGLTPRGKVVDLGCGPGLLAIELARRAPELHVTGIDLSDEMLAQAEELALTSQQAERVVFGRGDVLHLPFAEGSLDLAVSTLSLHHWAEPVAVLDEIARVLSAGGSFLIFDLRRDMIAPCWLLLWCVTRWAVPGALRRVNEPLSSRDAAYTASEAMQIAARSRLSGWHMREGPLWLTIEGTTMEEVSHDSGGV